MCIAIVNSTTPKLLDKWPPVLETFSTKKKRISFANDINSFFDNVFKNDELFYDEFNKIFTYNFILKEDVYDYHNYEIVFKCCLEDKNIFSCSFEKDGKLKNEENFLTFKNDFFNR